MKKSQQPNRRAQIGVECLEARTVPVIGVLGPGNPAPPGGTGGDFDGVVLIGEPGGTGSILKTPMYILTAAHVIGGDDGADGIFLSAGTVSFDYLRQGVAGRIVVEVPDGPDFLSVSPQWDPFPDYQTWDDIAIISLPDPENNTAGRVMIAPYRNTGWDGGNRYEIYSGDPIGKSFLMAGYGITGNGSDGEHDTPVQRITLPNPLDGAKNTFTISVHLDNETYTTDKIAQNADSSVVAAALDAAIADAVGMGIANGYFLVNNLNLGGGVWDIRTFSNEPVDGAIEITRYDDGKGPVKIDPISRWAAGEGSSGVRRSGENQFEQFAFDPDEYGPNAKNLLAFDFDHTAGKINVFGSEGLGGAETNTARGDSGGPALIRVGGVPQIAGVVSFGIPATKDITAYVDSEGKFPPDGSFGEVGAYTHAQPYMKDYIEPLINQKVDVVLDMGYQTYGKTVAGEDVAITVRKNGKMLEIDVQGQEATLNGVYARLDLATIKSLTIRGSDDNEVITIEGDLGFGGPIAIDGGGGKNDLIYDDAPTEFDRQFDFVEPPAKWDQRVNVSGTFVTSAGQKNITIPLDIKGISKLSVLGSSTNANIVHVNQSSAAFTRGAFVTGGKQIDVFTIGSDVNGLARILSKVGIDGDDDIDDVLSITDAAATADGTYILGSAVGAAGWEMRLSRSTKTGVGGAFEAKAAIDIKNIELADLSTGGGSDVVRIENTPERFKKLELSTGDGLDDIYIGSDAKGFDGLENKNLRVLVSGSVGMTDGSEDKAVLTYLDGKGVGPRTYQFDANTVGGGAGYEARMQVTEGGGLTVYSEFYTINKYVLETTDASDKVRIEATPGTAVDGVFVRGNGGDDVFTVGSAANGLNDVASLLNIDGGAGKNILTLDDAGGKGGPAAYKINKAAVAGSGAVTKNGREFIKFDKIQTPPTPDGNSIVFLGRAAGTEIEIAGLWSDTKFQFVGNTGIDLLRLTADTTGDGGSPARVEFVGGGGTDEVKVVTGGYQTGNPANVAADRYALAFAPLEILTVTGGLLDVTTNEAVEKYIQSGGVLDGTAILSVSQELVWTGGTMQGTGTTAALVNSQADVGPGGPLTLIRTLDLSGTSRWTGADILGDGTLANHGTFDAQGSIVGTFRNDGVLHIGWNGVIGDIAVTGPFYHTGGVAVFDVSGGTIDQITVNGTVALGGALDLTYLGGTLAPSYLLIANDLTDSVAPLFSNYAEGALVYELPKKYVINYTRGAGSNDVILSNEGPDAVDDSATVLEDSSANAIAVLANDTDRESDTLTVTAVGTPSSGTAWTDGAKVYYTPEPNFHGTVTLTYTIADGFDSTDTATVTITVQPVNDAPVATGASVMTPQNTTIDVDLRTLVTDVETAAANMTFVVANVTNGTVLLLSNGYTARFIPTAWYHGPASFTYTATDTGDGTSTPITTAPKTIAVAVNTGPTAASDSATTSEDTPVTISVLANDSDADGDELTVASAGGGANGTTTVNADGTITYTPNANWSGTDTFSYWVSDGHGGLTEGTVTVTVTPVNDPPTSTGVTPPVVQIDTAIDIDLRVLVGDLETPVTALTFEVGYAVGGTIVLLPDGHTARFTPTAGHYGAASFRMSVTDVGLSGDTGETLALTIDLTVNRPPVATDATFTVSNAGPVVLALASYASDPDGDVVTVTQVSTPTAGSASINASGEVVYLPPTGFTGTVTFQYTVSDGRGGTAQATVTITVVNGTADEVKIRR